ncbi:polysaccharide pyruvyl transferase family protein [Streptomyces sparsus]
MNPAAMDERRTAAGPTAPRTDPSLARAADHLAEHAAEDGSRGARTDRGKTLLTGWFSFLDGEVTAGDVLALYRVQEILDREQIAYDTVWSPGYRPDALHFDDVDDDRYGRLVFVCGPVHGPQVEGLHRRFAHCHRLAVGVSVVDASSPAARGFHRVVARDGTEAPPTLDLSSAACDVPRAPVAGVALTRGQGEYGALRRHDRVADAVTGWLAGEDCARVELDTRLARDDWRLCGTVGQFDSLLRRLDVLVTNRLHGLVLALRAGVPALVVDPVEGGAKVTAQAQACNWPAVIPADEVTPDALRHWWRWCLTSGPQAALRARLAFDRQADTELTAALAAASRSSLSH